MYDRIDELVHELDTAHAMRVEGFKYGYLQVHKDEHGLKCKDTIFFNEGYIIGKNVAELDIATGKVAAYDAK